MLQEPHQVSLNNSTSTDDQTFASFTSENGTSFMDNCCSNVNSNKNDHNCINLITPSSSPIGNDTASNSILRNRLQVNQLSDSEVVSFGKNESAARDPSMLQTQLLEKTVPLKKRTDLSFPSVTNANKSSSILPAAHSVSLQKSMHGNKLNMNIRKVLVKANSEFKEEKNSDVKTNVSQFIYESVRYISNNILRCLSCYNQPLYTLYKYYVNVHRFVSRKLYIVPK